MSSSCDTSPASTLSMMLLRKSFRSDLEERRLHHVRTELVMGLFVVFGRDLRLDLVTRVPAVFVPSRDGESGKNPFAEGDKKGIAAKVVDHSDEEKVLEDQLRPEMGFPCIPASAGPETVYRPMYPHHSQRSGTIPQKPCHQGCRKPPSDTTLQHSAPLVSGSRVQSCQ